MAHTFTNLLTHVIFSSKNRAPCIRAELKPQLYAYMGGIIREMKGKALMIDGTADHIHLLISLPPALSIAETLRVMKTNSSRWVHETWPSHRDFAWQIGYGAFSVSKSNASAVLKYIASQEKHHQRMSFQEEFIALLKKHGIEYDERYIWE
ncbi:MAG TPA: IS200/IS605 family transposase [Blastocatellia bacterium]|jgi:REP element-mobilizing transposase RayT